MPTKKPTPHKTEPIYARIGARIQSRRIACGLTQKDLGECLTPPQRRGFVAHVEAGRHALPVHILLDLAHHLELHLPTLLAPDGEVRRAR